MGRGRIDLFGATFGRLTVTRYIGNGKKCSWWEARCACGNTAYVSTQALRRRGRPTRSCGCLIGQNKEHLKATRWGSMFKQSLYRQWIRIRNEAPLQLCQEWRERYDVVACWCLANGWNPDLRMVRLDIGAPWGPDNVLLVPMRKRQHRRHDVVRAA